MLLTECAVVSHIRAAHACVREKYTLVLMYVWLLPAYALLDLSMHAPTTICLVGSWSTAVMSAFNKCYKRHGIACVTAVAQDPSGSTI
jgi:hypothetical protein